MGLRVLHFGFHHDHLIPVTMLYVYLKYTYIYIYKNGKCQIFALRFFLNLNMNFEYFISHTQKIKKNTFLEC